MRKSNEYPSLRHSQMAFERFTVDELKAKASDLFWTGERYQNGPIQACWTVWQHCCTITPTSAVPSPAPVHSMRDVQHMLVYEVLNAPTQESRDEASKQLAQLAVLSPASKTRVAVPSPKPSSCGTPIPTIICGCGGGMLFTRVEGAELDATCTQCWCTITLTPKPECYGSNPGAQAQAESAVPSHSQPLPRCTITREELVKRILKSWEMEQGKISPLTRWLAEDAADTIMEAIND